MKKNVLLIGFLMLSTPSLIFSWGLDQLIMTQIAPTPTTATTTPAKPKKKKQKPRTISAATTAAVATAHKNRKFCGNTCPYAAHGKRCKTPKGYRSTICTNHKHYSRI